MVAFLERAKIAARHQSTPQANAVEQSLEPLQVARETTHTVEEAMVLSIRAARIIAILVIAIGATVLSTQQAWALGQEQYVQFSAAPGSFTIVNANTTATIS